MKKNDHILMVDQDRLFLTHIRNELLLQGYRNFQIAESLREAVHKSKETEFDTVLIDLFMSRLSGLKIAELIEKIQKNAKIILLLKEEFQPVLSGELRFPISLKRDLLPLLLQDC